MLEISPKESFIKVKNWVWKKLFTLFKDTLGPNFPWFQFVSEQLWPCPSDTGRIGYNINVIHFITHGSYANRLLCIMVNVSFMLLWAWDARWGVGWINWNDFLPCSTLNQLQCSVSQCISMSVTFLSIYWVIWFHSYHKYVQNTELGIGWLEIWKII